MVVVDVEVSGVKMKQEKASSGIVGSKATLELGNA
jgi:hypothetical protein